MFGGVNMREGQLYIEKHFKKEKIKHRWGGGVVSQLEGAFNHIRRGVQISLPPYRMYVVPVGLAMESRAP